MALYQLLQDILSRIEQNKNEEQNTFSEKVTQENGVSKRRVRLHTQLSPQLYHAITTYAQSTGIQLWVLYDQILNDFLEAVQCTTIPLQTLQLPLRVNPKRGLKPKNIYLCEKNLQSLEARPNRCIARRFVSFIHYGLLFKIFIRYEFYG